MEDKPSHPNFEERLYGAKLVKMFQFLNGPPVPMYDVSTISGLNQLIGFAKFVKQDYRAVYYRGVNKVFNSVLSSIMRKRKPAKRGI